MAAAAAAASGVGAAAAAAGPSKAHGTMMFVSAENTIVRDAIAKFCSDPRSRSPLDLRVADFDGPSRLTATRTCQAATEGSKLT